MLHNMVRGESGRIVLEIDPSQKEVLYSALTRDGLTLKDWFLRQAAEYLREQAPRPLSGALVIAEEPTPYMAKPQPATVPRVDIGNSRSKAKRK